MRCVYRSALLYIALLRGLYSVLLKKNTVKVSLHRRISTIRSLLCIYMCICKSSIFQVFSCRQSLEWPGSENQTGLFKNQPFTLFYGHIFICISMFIFYEIFRPELFKMNSSSISYKCNLWYMYVYLYVYSFFNKYFLFSIYIQVHSHSCLCVCLCRCFRMYLDIFLAFKYNIMFMCIYFLLCIFINSFIHR